VKAGRADSARRKSNEGGLSRDQTSLYTKVDALFPTRQGRLPWKRSRKQML